MVALDVKGGGGAFWVLASPGGGGYTRAFNILEKDSLGDDPVALCLLRGEQLQGTSRGLHYIPCRFATSPRGKSAAASPALIRTELRCPRVGLEVGIGVFLYYNMALSLIPKLIMQCPRSVACSLQVLQASVRDTKWNQCIRMCWATAGCKLSAVASSNALVPTLLPLLLCPGLTVKACLVPKLPVPSHPLAGVLTRPAAFRVDDSTHGEGG